MTIPWWGYALVAGGAALLIGRRASASSGPSTVDGTPVWPLRRAPKKWKAGSNFQAGRPWGVHPPERWHGGVDLGAPAGTTLLAPEAGTVIAPNSGWESLVVDGQVVGVKALVMQTDSGKTLLLGGIAPKSATVKAGERVTAGQKIAEIGRYPGPKKDGNGDSMLHFQAYDRLLTEAEVNARKSWPVDGERPADLIDPTAYLELAMASATTGLEVASLVGDHDVDIEGGEEAEGTPAGDAENA